MKIPTKLKKREAEEFDDSPERALDGADFARDNTGPFKVENPTPTKRDERRARRQEKAVEKQRQKQQRAAQIHEEAYQM